MSLLYFRHFLEHFRTMIRSLLRPWFSAVLLIVIAFLRPQTVQAELAKCAIMETNVAYLRVAQTDNNFPNELMSAASQIA